MIILMRNTVKDFDLDQTDRLLTTTRAVRRRLDLQRPVEPAVVLDCLRVAAQAPSGGNGQRWRWVLVRDPDKRSAIADLYAASFAAYVAPRRAALQPDDLGDVLGIPDTVTQVALLPVAYSTGDEFRPAPRRPVEEITYWDTWKEVAP
jgi:nitroreductase